MQQPSSEQEIPSNSTPQMLKEFLALPLPSRAACIHEISLSDLSSATHYVQMVGLDIPDRLDRRLAWAVAFIIGELAASRGADADADGGTPQERKFRKNTKRLDLNERFADFWGALTKPFFLSNPGHSSSRLNELALSVLCERKNDDEWQDPLLAPLDVQVANDAYDYVYWRNRALVLGFARKIVKDPRLPNPEDIASDAWSMMYADHWHPDASERFQGRCRISTRVCLMASKVVRKELDTMNRNQHQYVREGGGTVDAEGDSKTFALDQIGVRADSADKIAGKQLVQKVRECIDLMPPRRRLVAYLIFLEGMSPKDVMIRTGMKKESVSQHSTKAREELRDFLREHGFDVPE